MSLFEHPQGNSKDSLTNARMPPPHHPAYPSSTEPDALHMDQIRERLWSTINWSKMVLELMYQELCNEIHAASSQEDKMALLEDAAQRLELLKSIFEAKRSQFEKWLVYTFGLSDFFPARALHHDAFKAFDDRERAGVGGKGSCSMAGFISALQDAVKSGADIAKIIDDFQLEKILKRGNLHMEATGFNELFAVECQMEFKRQDRDQFLPWITLQRFIENLENDQALGLRFQAVKGREIQVRYTAEADLNQTLPVAFIPLRRVIAELINNSVDALLTSASSTPQIQVHFKCSRKDSRMMWEIRVTDNGPGIDCLRLGIQDPDQVFKEKVSSHGAGEGLALARKIIRNRFGDGSIEIEHSSPQGTTVLIRFSLPLEPKVST